MSLYLVRCDLEHPREFGEYVYFQAALRESRADKVLPTAWALRSSLKADAIRDRLVKFEPEDDRMLVAEVNERNWAAWKAMAEITGIEVRSKFGKSVRCRRSVRDRRQSTPEKKVWPLRRAPTASSRI